MFGAILQIFLNFLCTGQSNLMAASNSAAQVNVNGSTYHTVYINPHPSLPVAAAGAGGGAGMAATAPITSTFLYHHPSTASQLSHPHHPPPTAALTSALTAQAAVAAAAGPGGDDRVTSTTSWNVTGQCTSSPYAGELLCYD